jgi:tetratricopeptide (TPR) repeat protein
MEKRCSFYSLILAFLLILSMMNPLVGCGPSKEQLAAMEKQRLQREARARAEAEALRQQEEARINQIRSHETAGDGAVQRGAFDKAIGHYQEVLNKIDRYDDQDLNVRKKIIIASQSMKTPPGLPEDYVRYMTRGQAKIKMGGAGSFEAASKEMEQAVMAAPWWGDGYYNLGIVQEKAGKYGEAMQNFQLYLIASPSSADAKIIRAKLYEIEVMKEEEDKAKGLQGTWSDGFTVSIEGRKILINNDQYSIQVEKKGLALEGFVSIKARRNGACDVPGETNPVSGSIGEDGHSITLRFMESQYRTAQRWVQDPFWGNLGGKHVCTGVTLLEKTEKTIKLDRGGSPAKRLKK